MTDKPKSLDEVDPKLIETYNKLGIPLNEQKKLSGVAVDAVFDSVSVATTFKDTLTKKGCNGKSAKCITHNLWDELETHINIFFQEKNLGDLINKTENRPV